MIGAYREGYLANPPQTPSGPSKYQVITFTLIQPKNIAKVLI